MKKRDIYEYLCAVALVFWQMHGYAQAQDCDRYTDDVRILVAYTTAVENQYPGEVLSKLIQPSIDNMNTAYANSGIGHRVRLVRAVKYDYDENNKDILSIRNTFSSNFGVFDNIPDQRYYYHADICILIVGSGAIGPTGIATEVGAVRSYAYAVVKSSQMVSKYSMVHEIGHLYGCRHELGQAGDKQGETTHGYVLDNTNAQGFKDHTIMAYGAIANGGVQNPPIPYFSSPNRTYNSNVLGDANSNAAQQMNAGYGNLKGINLAEVINIETDQTIMSHEIVDINAYSSLKITSKFIIKGDASTYLRVGMDSGEDGTIKLSPGFHAKAGSYMRAYTCASSNSVKIANTKTLVEIEKTALEVEKEVIFGGQLSAYPNPFTDKVSIKYILNKDQPVNLMFYDIAGIKMNQSIIDEPQTAGEHEFIFDGSLISLGIYIYKLSIDGLVNTGKIIKVK